MKMNFADLLCKTVIDKRTPLMVGIDPRANQLPRVFLEQISQDRNNLGLLSKVVAQYGRELIDVVANIVPAIKPQLAFFEQWGVAGMMALREIVDHAQSQGLIVILDAKRGDIGSTAEAYAAAYLGRGNQSAWGGDALTVNPYLGRDSLQPFVDRCQMTNSGIFVLVKTSNPGGRDYQDLQSGNHAVFQRVAEHVEEFAKKTLGSFGYGSVGAVVGATYPQELADLRRLMPHTLFLVPGFGAQGGTASDIAPAFRADGLGAIVNSSRDIIFAYRRSQYSEWDNSNWQRAVELAASDSVQQLRDKTPAKFDE